jgi:hypothetical protein
MEREESSLKAKHFGQFQQYIDANGGLADTIMKLRGSIFTKALAHVNVNEERALAKLYTIVTLMPCGAELEKRLKAGLVDDEPSPSELARILSMLGDDPNEFCASLENIEHDLPIAFIELIKIMAENGSALEDIQIRKLAQLNTYMINCLQSPNDMHCYVNRRAPFNPNDIEQRAAA